MSISYIVDGYNAIKSAAPYCDLPLRQARERFFSYLETRRPHGSLRNRLIVVFDGSSEVFGCRNNQTFEIIFTSGESADDKIQEIVVSSKNPGIVVVVTDDRALGYAVRRAGARTMSCHEFFKTAAVRGARASVREPDTKNLLNIVQREKITEECRKIWLKRP
ncbi:MAG: NYN domain-containing protein [Candidatus Omnitrophica bacterium]|nr:NYN domain-containing protein [Candidatus Omnitrophota bacterium]